MLLKFTPKAIFLKLKIKSNPAYRLEFKYIQDMIFILTDNKKTTT